MVLFNLALVSESLKSPIGFVMYIASIYILANFAGFLMMKYKKSDNVEIILILEIRGFQARLFNNEIDSGLLDTIVSNSC